MSSDFSQKQAAMVKAGQIIGQVKAELRKLVRPGLSFLEIDSRARSLIEKAGAQTNFDLEPGYHWATCVNVNAGIVHGIPHPHLYLNEGDLLKIDLGCSWEGWNVDTAMCLVVGEDLHGYAELIKVGEKALHKALSAVKLHNSIADISVAMEKVILAADCDPIYELVGHGIGRHLHEEPAIPCSAQRRDKQKKITAGQGLAVEVMFAAGDATLKLAADGWTYESADGSPTILLEETVLVLPTTSLILTQEPGL